MLTEVLFIHIIAKRISWSHYTYNITSLHCIVCTQNTVDPRQIFYVSILLASLTLSLGFAVKTEVIGSAPTSVNRSGHDH